MIQEKTDILIIGSGPAGLQAAIHATRRNVSVMIAGKVGKSSAYNAHIDNFCCVDGDNGADMLAKAREKVTGSGVTQLDEDVTHISMEENGYHIITESGSEIDARSVVLAMGISRNRLGLHNEKELLGRGVSYCVDCDGGFFRNENVAVVGSESAAVTGALTLLFYAKEVHLVSQRLDVSDALAESVRDSAVVVHEGVTPVKILGDELVNGLVLNDGTVLEVSGIFIELGARGALELAGELGITMTPPDMKFIAVNKKQETNIAGIYAAGDICGPPWQIAKAVGEGCIAGLEAAGYVRNNAANR